MRVRIRVRKILFLGTLLIVCTVAGGLGFAYSYYTDSTNLKELIRKEFPRYLPQAKLDLGTVRVRPLIGELKVTHVNVRQVIDGVNSQTLYIPWLHVRVDPKALFKGHCEPQEVIVAQPKLWLCRRKDGTWNIQGLLADPWPAPPMKQTPPIIIQNATIMLSDPSAAAEGGETLVTVLDKASFKVEADQDGLLKFEGSANKGDVLDRLDLRGTIDVATGRVTLSGDVTRLVPSERLFSRLPPDVSAAIQKSGLSGGEVDLELESIGYDPKAEGKLHYSVSGQLHAGVWNCPKLPFPINDVRCKFSVCDGLLTIKEATGSNGSTTVHGNGRVVLGAALPELNLNIGVNELEFDDRLRKWLPPEFAATWDEFRPRGRVNIAVNVKRPAADAPVAIETHTECLDVGMEYAYFRYPLDHMRGHVDWVGNTVSLDLATLIAGQPLRARGTIENPGPDAVVKLDFQGAALPIDKTLLGAIPPEITKVINDFEPSGSVRGTAHFERKPPLGPHDDPKGRITIDAALDLNERCSIQWAGLPYPIENLTGHLELHPDHWTFKDMRGQNGQAVVTGYGDVRKLGVDAEGKDELKIDLHLHAEHLPFDQELQRSLPQAWQKTWPVLNPIGSSDVDAHILVEPHKPERYHIEVVPKQATSVRLKFERTRRSAADPGGLIEMRMEDVNGRFVFDNGTVRMQDVAFKFRESPVQFAEGTVQVENNGGFRLAVSNLWARDFRLDAGLREKMPPVMGQFARRLDDGHTFEFTGNLALNWSGDSNQPVHCLWNSVQVVLDDNKLEAGIPLKNIHGILRDVQGSSDGESLNVDGVLQLSSVFLVGQQVTNVEAPFHIGKGTARLDNIRAELLGGEVNGDAQISLDTTPRYSANLTLRDADLEHYARTIPGRQRFRGLVSADVAFKGLGGDLRTLQGGGEAHIRQGDLGELPSFLTFMKVLTLTPVTKTAFDSADVYFKIENGQSLLDPIKFTGDAFSLMGKGTLDVQGALDLRLRVLYGRDRMHLAYLSDALREASGQFLVVRVQGTPGYPTFDLEPLPGAKALAERRAARIDASATPGERRPFVRMLRP